MKKSFACSLCHKGILGGGLYLDDKSVTYRTGKITVEKRFKNLVIPFEKIEDISWKWIIFPIATFTTTDNEKFSFIIYNRRGFLKSFYGVSAVSWQKM